MGLVSPAPAQLRQSPFVPCTSILSPVCSYCLEARTQPGDACFTVSTLCPPFSCSYCLEAHARAGMLVDTQRLKEMLMAVLPDALKGASVAQLAPRLPWPAATKNRTSVLWWA